MRAQLRDITEHDYWLYGLTEADFDYTLGLVRGFLSDQQDVLEKKEERAKLRYPDPAIHVEIISDLHHYSWVSCQVLWQFCLWRLQGILEGLIVHSFLLSDRSKRMSGLQAKLDALRVAGYSISENEYDELLAWASLRNALSHAPPERYCPGPLAESDIVEYKETLQRLCKRWREEERIVKNKANG